MRRVERAGAHQVLKLQPFNDQQMNTFFEKQLGSEKLAAERVALLEDVESLMGLSTIPRMLAFEDLLECRQRAGSTAVAQRPRQRACQ